MREGRGVDLVCSGEDLPKHFQSEEFDMVVSTETWEHARDWREFLLGIWHVLKTDGHFVCTLASLKKRRHAYPDDYWRMNEELMRKIFEGQEIIDVNDGMGISYGFVIKKKTSLVDLKPIHLIPVDDKVPQELLEQK